MSQWGGSTSCEHVVQFYDDTAELIAELEEFVAQALPDGGALIVLANAEHRRALRERSAKVRVIELDAAEALERVVIDGHLDRDRFRALIEPLLRAELRRGDVAVFGEAVSLLWDEGNLAAVLELETAWNDLLEDFPFRLLCAYAATSFRSSADVAAASRVCGVHTSVVASTRYRAPAAQSQMFLADTASIARARAFVARALACVGQSDRVIANAQLVVSELATNSIRHAGGPFLVVAAVGEGCARVEVHDVSPSAPVVQHALANDTTGRGLAIVATLARRWGMDELGAGKRVWAELSS